MSSPASSPSAVVPFQFESHEIRTIVKDGEPWFVATDICAALGLENVTKSLLRIPEQHRALNPIQGVDGKIRETNIISESGMYRLVLRSDKPQAEPFIEWVTAEVLPSIRKTGVYALPPRPGQQKEIKGDWVTSKDMAAKWACSLATAKRYLQRMVAAGQAVVIIPSNPRSPYLYQFTTSAPAVKTELSLSLRRFLTTFDHEGKIQMQEIDKDAYIFPLYRLPEILKKEFLSDKDLKALPGIISAAACRL